jgi:hypothetical protein
MKDAKVRYSSGILAAKDKKRAFAKRELQRPI